MSTRTTGPYAPGAVEVVWTGVTRVVVLWRGWAVKLPRGYRGVLANESEWRQRRRPDVNPPVFTLAHLAMVSRRADALMPWGDGSWMVDRQADGYSNEEAKESSWGRFGRVWRLIDYDRAWQEPRTLLARPYYARQEWLGRRWARLPERL